MHSLSLELGSLFFFFFCLATFALFALFEVSFGAVRIAVLMSELFEFSDDAFYPRGSVHSNFKRPNLFLSLGNHVDLYFPPQKRSRISAPFVFCNNGFKKQQQSFIEALPNECLFEIFRRLPGDQEKSACACVSKRWLMLLSDIHQDDFCSRNITKASSSPVKSVLNEGGVDSSERNSKCVPAAPISCDTISVVEEIEFVSDGHLSRSLEGRKATDTRLAAIAVGTPSRGGLGKLLIRGSNPTRGVTDAGLCAIARGCLSLRVLSLSNVPSIGDKGILEIAKGCQQLQKLELCQCPLVSDEALLAIARNCPNLTDLTVESCPSIHDEGLKAISQHCLNLKSVTIKNCHLIGDQGIVSLLSSSSSSSSSTPSLSKIKLHALNITDASLAVIGHYGIAVTDLVLTGLPHVSERGFWVMFSGQGLQELKTLTIKSCPGVTDVGLDALGKGCPKLKQFCLHGSAALSDAGLVSFVKSAGALETLALKECHRITQCGVVAAVVSCSSGLRSFALGSCFGIRDSTVLPLPLPLPPLPPCNSLRSFSVHGCPGFSDTTLSVLGKFCPRLQCLELVGLHGITDAGLVPLVESLNSGLVKVDLSNCVNITDATVSAIARLHGGTLEQLSLDGCGRVTDASVVAMARDCSALCDLDLSKCAITDLGIAALACSNVLELRVVSVAGCSMVTERSLFFMEKLGRALAGLNLQHCTGIGHGKVSQLAEQLWRCDVLA